MKIFGWKSTGRASARPAQLAAALSRAPFIQTGHWPGQYDAQLREGYFKNPIALRAVRLVAEGAASARITGNDAAAVRLITTTSHGQQLIETLATHILLHGNAYAQIMMSQDGRPAELYALRPERMTVEADARGWPSGFRYKVADATTRMATDEIIHIRTHNPLDDHYGLGCLDAASGPIAIHNASSRWNKALLDNAARPSGALLAEGVEAMKADQFERLKDELERAFQGAANAGRPMLLEGGLKWQPLSLSPADMDFAGLKAAAAREIALAFGVPPVLLGLPGDATYANYKEANKALWQQSILPLANKIIAALAQGLSPWFPGLTLAIDMEAVPALSEDRERLWAQLDSADFLTRDEKREAAGFAALHHSEL